MERDPIVHAHDFSFKNEPSSLSRTQGFPPPLNSPRTNSRGYFGRFLFLRHVEPLDHDLLSLRCGITLQFSLAEVQYNTLLRPELESAHPWRRPA